VERQTNVDIIHNCAIQTVVASRSDIPTESDIVLPWSWDDLKLAQLQDKDIQRYY